MFPSILIWVEENVNKSYTVKHRKPNFLGEINLLKISEDTLNESHNLREFDKIKSENDFVSKGIMEIMSPGSNIWNCAGGGYNCLEYMSDITLERRLADVSLSPLRTLLIQGM
jgi:hypothetical protein